MKHVRALGVAWTLVVLQVGLLTGRFMKKPHGHIGGGSTGSEACRGDFDVDALWVAGCLVVRHVGLHERILKHVKALWVAGSLVVLQVGLQGRRFLKNPHGHIGMRGFNWWQGHI